MSHLKQLAAHTQFDSDILDGRFETAFGSIGNSIDNALHTLTSEQMTNVCQAVETLVNETGGQMTQPEREERATNIANVQLERIKRIKKGKVSKIGKQIFNLLIMLYIVGLRSADSVKELLTRRSFETLADRSLEFVPVWYLISRLYDAGVKCSLRDVRADYRTMFNQMTGETAISSKDAKRRIAESMLGFKLPDSFYAALVAGSKKDVKVGDDTATITVSSQLQKYEQALKTDRENQTKGIASDTAAQFKFNVETIKKDVETFLANEQAAKDAVKQNAANVAADNDEAKNTGKVITADSSQKLGKLRAAGAAKPRARAAKQGQ